MAGGWQIGIKYMAYFVIFYRSETNMSEWMSCIRVSNTWFTNTIVMKLIDDTNVSQDNIHEVDTIK